MNQVNIAGYVGQDADLKTTQNGDERVVINLGVSKYMGKGNDSKTMWFRVVVDGEYNVKTAKDARKGDRLIASGSIESREYQDRNGATQKITEIIVSKYGGEVIVIPKADRASNGYQSQPAPQQQTMNHSEGKHNYKGGGPINDLPRNTSQSLPPMVGTGDDIPF